MFLNYVPEKYTNFCNNCAKIIDIKNALFFGKNAPNLFLKIAPNFFQKRPKIF